MSEDIAFRLLADGDWDAVVELEHDAYAADGLSEGRVALQSRARPSPGTCYVLEHRGRVRGYVLSLPYPSTGARTSPGPRSGATRRGATRSGATRRAATTRATCTCTTW
ncbi:hypothetical protein ACFQ0M_09680 [Kitasatospora aburaviensis]